MRCSAYLSPSGVITVCPALLPPWQRTTYGTRPPSRSVALPLPSSPHWAPISTTAGISLSSPSDSSPAVDLPAGRRGSEIGRAAGRERVEISAGGGLLKKKL